MFKDYTLQDTILKLPYQLLTSVFDWVFSVVHCESENDSTCIVYTQSVRNKEKSVTSCRRMFYTQWSTAIGKALWLTYYNGTDIFDVIKKNESEIANIDL